MRGENFPYELIQKIKKSFLCFNRVLNKLTINIYLRLLVAHRFSLLLWEKQKVDQTALFGRRIWRPMTDGADSMALT